MADDADEVGARPSVPFHPETAVEMWSDPHVSAQMLAFHLDGVTSRSSRPAAFVEHSLRWLIGRFGIDRRTAILDLGCGPGLYTNPLARSAGRVVGVDVSARSLEHARATAPSGAGLAYVHGDYLDAAVDGTYDLVLMVMCDYSALGPQRRARLLERVRGWLADGGHFVFDVHGAARFDRLEETATDSPELMGGFWAPGPYHGHRRTYLYPRERVSLDRYDIVEPERTRTFYNWLQHFDRVSITREVERGGLAVEAIHGDIAGSDLTADADELCVVARRI